MRRIAKRTDMIESEAADAKNYLSWLLRKAYSLGLLNNSELEGVQLQLVQLLARQVERYTGGESSSVRVEAAQGILQSVFYCVGLYLKSLPDAETRLELLKRKPLSELHRRGRELAARHLAGARELLRAVQNNGLATENRAYNETVREGIPLFFSSYDADFGAHDTPGAIDYPLYIENPDLAGIEYISCYLEKLLVENRFCRRFAARDIDRLLRGYHDNYQELLVNIFGLVLTNAVGLALANKNTLQLNIGQSDRQYLQRKLGDLSKKDLDAALLEASERVCAEIDISDGLLCQYIGAGVKDISARIKNALENHRLESVFISLKGAPAHDTFRFEEGMPMNDESLRSLIDEIRDCRFVSDKVAIIQREIQSATDLVDILEGYCIFDREYDEVFQSLGDMELALLSKKLPLYEAESDLHYTENEKEWQGRLTDFLDRLDSARREEIRGLADRIDSGW